MGLKECMIVYSTIIMLTLSSLYHHVFEYLPFVKNLSPANVPVDFRQLMMIACPPYVHVSEIMCWASPVQGRYIPGERRSHAVHFDGHAYVTAVLGISDPEKYQASWGSSISEIESRIDSTQCNSVLWWSLMLIQGTHLCYQLGRKWLSTCFLKPWVGTDLMAREVFTSNLALM